MLVPVSIFVERNARVDLLAVVRRRAKHVYLLIERHDRHLINGPELIDESDRRILDLLELEFGRVAHVEHQHDRERLLLAREVRYLLVDAILENLEILLL